MKSFFNFALVGLLAASMGSCAKKDQNIIKGNITYIGAVTGSSFVGAGATVGLYTSQTSTTAISTTTADASGNYRFSPVLDGTWWVYAALEDDFGTFYDSQLSIFVEKEDIGTVNLVLRN